MSRARSESSSGESGCRDPLIPLRLAERFKFCQASHVAYLARSDLAANVLWEGMLNGRKEAAMIRKLRSGQYRLYSRKVDPKTGKRRNLGTFATREQAQKHERAVQFFKHR